MLLPGLLPLLALLPGIPGWGPQVQADTRPQRFPAQDPRYKVQLPKPVAVQEGLCVFIPCTFSYPPDGWEESDPAHGFWFRHRARINIYHEAPVATNKPGREVEEETRGRFQLVGDPEANNCSLRITDARRKDSGWYFFRLERGPVMKFSYMDYELRVSVAELTHVPDIVLTESLESGRSSNVTCSAPWACDRGTPLTFSWTMSPWTGTALRAHSEDYNSSVVTLSPGPQDHSTHLICRVTLPNTGVTTEKSIRLNVSYAPQNLTISFFRGNLTDHLDNGSSLQVLEGESLRLICVANSNPLAALTWARGKSALSTSQPSGPGVLELPRVQKEDEGKLTCRARNSLGSASISVSLVVFYPPQLRGPACSWEGVGLRCSCSARASPAPSVRWRIGDELLEANSSNASVTVTSSSAGPWANSSLSLRAGLSPGRALLCEARNEHGAYSATVLLLPGRPERGGEFVRAALTGAGLAAPLFLGPCLIFLMVKTCRRRRAETAAGGLDTPSVPGATVGSPQHESQAGGPLDGPPPAVAAATSGEDKELHYASLVFQGLRPWEPQAGEAASAASTTEYAELKVRQ